MSDSDNDIQFTWYLIDHFDIDMCNKRKIRLQLDMIRIYRFMDIR